MDFFTECFVSKSYDSQEYALCIHSKEMVNCDKINLFPNGSCGSVTKLKTYTIYCNS